MGNGIACERWLWTVAAVLIVVSAAVCRAASPDEAESLLQRFIAAHASTQAHEVWYWTPAFETPEVASLFERAKAAGGELSRTTDPQSGRAVWRTMDYHLICDGVGDVRVEKKSLFEAGPEDGRTRVEIWRPDERAVVSPIGATRGTLDRFDVLTPDQQVSLRARGRYPYAMERAELGYLQAARYAISMLSGAPDVRVVTLGRSEEAVLGSSVRGVAAKIDASTGELLRLRIQSGADSLTLMEFTGRFDERIFPARYPRKVRFAYIDGDWTKTWRGASGERWATEAIPADLSGATWMIERVESLKAAPEDAFSWRRLVPSVTDTHAGCVFWADSRDPAAAEAAAVTPTMGTFGRFVGIDDGPDRRAPVKSRWNGRRIAAEIGIACVVLGLVVWGRWWWGKRALRTGATPRSGSR